MRQLELPLVHHKQPAPMHTKPPLIIGTYGGDVRIVPQGKTYKWSTHETS